MNKIFRQGDVLLVKVDKMPEGCKTVAPTARGIVLAFGEVTGHAHAITDHGISMAEAGRLARNALHSAKVRARLHEAPNGTRFLEVLKPVMLRHEEHSPAKIAPGIYEMPAQAEHTADKIVRRVAD